MRFTGAREVVSPSNGNPTMGHRDTWSTELNLWTLAHGRGFVKGGYRMKKRQTKTGRVRLPFSGFWIEVIIKQICSQRLVPLRAGYRAVEAFSSERWSWE
jgi:hypothetical protein